MTSVPVLPVSSIRDLTLLDIGEGRVVIIACDSVGSIGPKPHDAYSASAELTAHCALRVPLLELIAAGGQPEVIVDALSVEMDPTGATMIAEIRRLAATIGLGADRITGSTEDNVPAQATGIGITVIGSAQRDRLRAGGARSGDTVLVLGAPTSAPTDAITMDDKRMVSIATLSAVVALDGVHDALPVGSHGIGWELEQLAASAGLAFQTENHGWDTAKSGGPSSCVLLAVDPDAVAAVRALLPAALPHTILGALT
jgi:selenophosphate synthetase-related protein